MAVIVVRPHITIYSLPQAPEKYWRNGCECEGWKNCAVDDIEYQCCWDEVYGKDGDIIEYTAFNGVCHEWSIKGSKHLILKCPWCGKDLQYLAGKK